MIETKGIKIEGVLQTALEQIQNNKTPTLVSITEKINKVDILSFFHKGKKLAKERSFWSNADQNVCFVGIGNAYTIKAEKNPYNIVKKEWSKLMERTILDNKYTYANTGPIAIGGFPFDEEKETCELWDGFEGSQFRIPEYMLTVDEHGCFLTINIWLDQQSDIENLAAILYDESSQLLDSAFIESENNQIVFEHEVNPHEWKNLVREVTNYIETYPVEKIVLARELQVELRNPCNITDVLHQLLTNQPNSYVFAWETDVACFIGASPERLVHVKDNQILSTCLAGTAPRGETSEEDIRIGQALLNDEKNREEHQIVVNMIRDSLQSCARNVDIPDVPIIYPLQNLQHLFTPVRAEIRFGCTLLEVVKKLHPTPALSGFPQKESLNFLRKHEKLERGWYGAPIGWFDSNFNGEFAVAIRSGLIKREKASLFAGCGIVKDSNPDMEYEETKIKFTPMLEALGG
ncbi:isochorismate synthase [Gracilibacillus ureilyticus]|uniref:isochorismate synthase n=1 Tax=Gracilibacillus ureilyticus TaxID=531814 RepID=A0A1H9TRI5_9BACI|nr:isochorismate synthase [Gracilibacillus ureilyticus]SER99628.1 isochorismate synthase [Gracilibacillus ureilyticus]